MIGIRPISLGVRAAAALSTAVDTVDVEPLVVSGVLDVAGAARVSSLPAQDITPSRISN